MPGWDTVLNVLYFCCFLVRIVFKKRSFFEWDNVVSENGKPFRKDKCRKSINVLRNPAMPPRSRSGGRGWKRKEWGESEYGRRNALSGVKDRSGTGLGTIKYWKAVWGQMKNVGRSDVFARQAKTNAKGTAHLSKRVTTSRRIVSSAMSRTWLSHGFI